jgi:hypothetical protein
MPRGTIWGAIGNHATCSLQGFMMIVGFSGAVFYSLSLTLYFLLRIRFGMIDTKIKTKVEPFLHAIPIIYSLSIGIYIYAMDQYNPAGPVCWIAPSPPNCELDPDVDCIEKPINERTLRWVAAGGPIFFGFSGNCLMLVLILRHNHMSAVPSSKNTSIMSNMNQRFSILMPTSIMGRGRHNDNDNDKDDHRGNENSGNCSEESFSRSNTKISSSLHHFFDGKEDESKQEETKREDNYEEGNIEDIRSTVTSNPLASSEINPDGPLAARLSRPSKASQRRQRQISNRAYAYIAGFLITYVFPTIYRIWNEYGNPPFFIMYLSRLSFPLQGFFNVLIYTYPHVTSLRTQTGYSYLKAFFIVVKSGGDNDEEIFGKRNRRDSVRKTNLLMSQYQRSNTHNSL